MFASCTACGFRALGPHTADVQRSNNGFARGFFSKSLRRPGCTLSRLHSSKEYDRPMTQSIETPEPGSLAPTLDRAGAHQGLGSVTTPASRRSVPPRLLNFDHFHKLCLLPGRIPGKVRKASVQMLRSAARVTMLRLGWWGLPSCNTQHVHGPEEKLK